MATQSLVTTGPSMATFPSTAIGRPLLTGLSPWTQTGAFGSQTLTVNSEAFNFLASASAIFMLLVEVSPSKEI